MLKKADLEKLAGLAKVPVADLEKAIKDTNEVEVKIPEGLLSLTTEEAETRDTNSKNEGIKIGKDLGVKEVRTKAGLEESVGKDPAKVAEAIVKKAVADAKVEPDKKVSELNERVSLLQKELGDKDTKITTLEAQTHAAALDTEILSSFPQGRQSLMSDKEYLTLVKSNLEFERVDGKVVVKKAGDIVRDPATKNPVGMADAVKGLFTERKWIETAAGSGAQGRGAGDNNTGGVFTKRSEVVADFERRGIGMNGAGGQQIADKLAELKKANPEFDMAG